ncbi:MAG: ABC transporter substrate-binding protein, partial [Lachnospiraceae bacterium]|nr:ABC transporter substrate-binding protein [Lachnospiraceae bacterium]
LVLIMVLSLSACGGKGNDGGKESGGSAESSEAGDSDAPEIQGLTFESETELLYAKCFRIFKYEGGYSYIEIPESGNYLVVPEGREAPEGLSKDVIVLYRPLDRIYLAATSAMALFDAVDAVGNIRLSGADINSWYIDSAVEALRTKKMLFAGKYSEPDYEMLINEGCDLAVESTMIYHTPKVKEMIEDLGIPVLVDRASYEEHPLGRTEWVKLYAVLTGKEEEAEEFFNKQAAIIEKLKDFENTGRTVAFFYVNTDGSIVVRNPDDYIAKMIDIAGGVYAFKDLPVDQGTSINISMEEFYNTAVDADYLIYNGTIDSPLTSVDDLIKKDALFKDFKAVKEGNVYTTGKSFYQATDTVGEMILDMNHMLTGEETETMRFLTHME